MLISEQLSLLDGTPSAPAPRRHRCPTCHAGFAPVGASQRIADQRAAADRDWTAGWERELAKHPEDELTILASVRALLASTSGSIGLAKVWELLRGKVAVDLNNNYRAPCARRLMTQWPDLAGRIRIRGDAGQVPERWR